MAAQVVIISGFLGAGKTTLIRRLASLCWPGQKLALVENEFGEVGIDGAFLAQTGLAVRELTSGCICCSLAGDFTQALCELVSRFSPEIILIEPSGVAKLSEVLRSVQDAGLETACAVTVCDAELCRDYAESFGEFYLDQAKNADLMMLSHIAGTDRQHVSDCAQYLGALNPHADVLAVPWDLLDAETLRQALAGAAEKRKPLQMPQAGHVHEHHSHAHHHPKAGQTFVSWACRPADQYTRERLLQISAGLASENAGTVLRAKGIVRDTAGGWLEFDYIRGHTDIRPGSPQTDSAFCVIGVDLCENRLIQLVTNQPA